MSKWIARSAAGANSLVARGAHQGRARGRSICEQDACSQICDRF
jgi:hypothetical protein